MKKLLLTFAIVGMIFTSCKKDEAKTQTKTVDYISTAYMLGSVKCYTSRKQLSNTAFLVYLDMLLKILSFIAIITMIAHLYYMFLQWRD